MLFTRLDLAEVMASEHMNMNIGIQKYDVIKQRLVKVLMDMTEEEFMFKFHKDRKFQLIRVIKNRYFLGN